MNYLKRKILIFALMLSVSLLLGEKVLAQEPTLTVQTISGNNVTCIDPANGDYKYYFIKNDETKTLTLTNKSFSTSGRNENQIRSYAGTLNIPSTVDISGETYTVTAIGFRACWDCFSYNTVVSIENDSVREAKYYTDAETPDPKTDLITVIIPSTVTSIGRSAFSDCGGLSTVEGLDFVTNIEQYAFCRTHISTLVFSKRLTTIGEQIFENNRYLTNITIPSSVTSIGKETFEGCVNLQHVYMERSTPPTLGTDAFKNAHSSMTIYVPCGALSTYKSATNWKTFSTKISKGMPEILTDNWHYSSDCGDCNIPSSVTIRAGGSLSADNYSDLNTKLGDIPIYIEDELTIDEFSLIGNIGGAASYSFVDNNKGNYSGSAHSIIALPFYYAGNSWGVDEHGNGATDGTNGTTAHTPVGFGESFFIYPTVYNNSNGTTKLFGDGYVTLTETITSSNRKLSNFTISLTNNNNDAIWFALCNPFIGKLNMGKFYTSNTSALNNTYAYVWNNEEHDWEAWEDINTSNKYAITPSTGFMVEGISNNPTFNFNVADIVTTESITTIKSSQANKIEFKATSNGIEKQMYAHIDDVSSNDFGRMDASVLFSAKEDAVNTYMKVGNHNLLDNYFSSLPATFDLNFNAYKSNTIDFVLSQTMDNIEITLIDLANDSAETVLNIDEPISINVTEGQNEGRYQLRFSKKNVGINEVASEDNSIQIWNNNSEVSINGKDLKKVEIFNTLGQLVYSSKLTGNSTTFDSKLNKGAYIIKAHANNSSKSEKIVIK
jgi:hypothetical protein